MADQGDLRRALAGDKNLNGADLTDAHLAGTVLEGAHLEGAHRSETDLTEARLSGVRLSDADLSGANLAGADLKWADLRRSDLRGADLSGAVLTGANLSGARLGKQYRWVEELSEPRTMATNLERSNLNEAMVAEVDFSNTRGLTQQQADSVSTAEQAVWPAGIDAPVIDTDEKSAVLLGKFVPIRRKPDGDGERSEEASLSLDPAIHGGTVPRQRVAALADAAHEQLGLLCDALETAGDGGVCPDVICTSDRETLAALAAAAQTLSGTPAFGQKSAGALKLLRESLLDWQIAIDDKTTVSPESEELARQAGSAVLALKTLLAELDPLVG